MRGEYIRRADAMEKITSSETQKALRAMTGEEAYVTVVGILNELPAADVRPVVVHGQWDGEGDGYADGELVIDVWYCSRCGHCIDDGTDDPAILPNYCPNCGAKMDGDG